jgi:CYTH domain-containing protein
MSASCSMTISDGRRTAVLTLKGRRHGVCREEYERSLELDWAEQVLGALPPTRIICKTRYRIRHRDGLIWLIDRFEGPNRGLVIAEIELAYPEQHIERPPWVGGEVTFDPRYGNSALARSPIQDCRSTARLSDSPLPSDDGRRVTRPDPALARCRSAVASPRIVQGTRTNLPNGWLFDPVEIWPVYCAANKTLE